MSRGVEARLRHHHPRPQGEDEVLQGTRRRALRGYYYHHPQHRIFNHEKMKEPEPFNDLSGLSAYTNTFLHNISGPCTLSQKFNNLYSVHKACECGVSSIFLPQSELNIYHVFSIKLLSECLKIEAHQWHIRISQSRGSPQNHHLSREALPHAAGRNHIIGALVSAAAVPPELDQVVAAVRQLWTFRP